MIYQSLPHSALCTNSTQCSIFILFYMEKIIIKILHQQFSFHWGLCLNTFIYLYFFHFNRLRFQHFNLISLKNPQMINVVTKRIKKKKIFYFSFECYSHNSHIVPFKSVIKLHFELT